MKIQNSFTLDAPMARVWPLLTDIPTVAACVPGVGLTHEADGVHSGSVKSKVGPVTAEYRSSARLLECNELQRRVVLEATGLDSRGEGNVQMLVEAQMASLGDRTRVDFSTEISGTGKVAELGRGVLQAASKKLLVQFVACMSAKLRDTEATANSLPAGGQNAADGSEPLPDSEALDLLGAAGIALAKRLVPVVIILVVIVVVLFIML